MCLFVYVANYSLIFTNPTLLVLSLVEWIDHLIVRDEKSLPQAGAFFENWVPTLIFLPYEIHFQKASPTSHDPLWDHLQRQVHCHQLGIIPPSGLNLSLIEERDYLCTFTGRSQRHPPAVNIRSPTLPNVCWHEGRDGEAISPIRLREEASDTWSRNASHEWKEMTHLPTPRLDHGSPEHSVTASVAREAHC